MSASAYAAATAAGLSEAEAARRLRERGRPARPPTSRSYRSIVVANTFTVFNAILVGFAVATLLFGDARDALFLGVVVANTAIGIGQEVRAKWTLDRLAALVAPRATVVRDGRARQVPVGEVLVDDLVRVQAGDQVVADGTLASSAGLALDEANLTGESEAVRRERGEPVWSGSFVVEGAGDLVATAVGEDSRAAQLTRTARQFRHPRSPLERAMDRLLIVLLACMVPLAAVLSISLVLRHEGRAHDVETLTASIANLVPEGLVLLVSLTAAVSAAKIGRRGVLAQQLNAIESLASVSVLCTDKTGTLTEAALRVVGLVPAGGVTEDALGRALARYAASTPSRNTTLEAVYRARLGDATGADGVRAQVPFSSRRRWSGIAFDDERLVLGAPEVVLDGDAALAERAAREASSGRRVLAIAHADGELPPPAPDAPLPDRLRPLGIVVLAERLRPDAERTVAFFASERVRLEVLSGDAPATVGAIARDAGVANAAAALDGRALPSDDDDLLRAVQGTAAIGRISPEDKARVVQVLKEHGDYVGMLGDGVNDVPALKQARLAIAQGSGTQMARSVADLVLVSGDFAEVPRMVHEGRQILRNIQRVARLFVTKAVYAAFLILAIAITTGDYPLLPRQFTLCSTLTIGIPSFLLALAPSSGAWRPERFLRAVARFSLPVGLAIGAGIVAGWAIARGPLGLSLTEARTVATAVIVTGGLASVLALEDQPGRRRRAVAGLCLAMALGLVLVWSVGAGRRFFDLPPGSGEILLAWAAGGATALALLAVALRLAHPRDAA